MAATQTTAKARPNALLVVAFGAKTAILVGTVNGVYVTWDDAQLLGTWTRFGSCSQLPVVLTLGLSYEQDSDTLLAATMGRGIYAIHGLKRALGQTHAELTATTPEVSA